MLKLRRQLVAQYFKRLGRLRSDQHPSAHGQIVGNEVSDRVALASTGRPLYDDARSAFRLLHNAGLFFVASEREINTPT